MFCGHGVPAAAYVSTGRFLEVNFTSGTWDKDGENDRIGFDLYFTAYHDGKTTSSYTNTTTYI